MLLIGCMPIYTITFALTNTPQDPRTVVGKVIDSVMGKSHATASDRIADAAGSVHLGGGHKDNSGAAASTPEPFSQEEQHHESKVGTAPACLYWAVQGSYSLWQTLWSQEHDATSPHKESSMMFH
jgi:hypothetical protein